MKTLILKTATALTLGAGLAVSGLASAENWTTHVGQVRADLPTQPVVASGAGTGENYQHFVAHVRSHGPQALSRGEVLVGENYRPHIEAVRKDHELSREAARVSLSSGPEQVQRGPVAGVERGRQGFR